MSAAEFFNVLTAPELLQKTEAYLPEHRERLYPPTETLSMFMRQVLSADGSCQKAVNDWAARRVADGLSVQSIRTGAYCKARQRLPLEMITELTRETGRLLNARTRICWQWRGRTVKLVDGTGISMPDTAQNQACYPQPNSQLEGVGFPAAQVIGVVCLSTGALLQAAMGPRFGQGNSELGLLRSLESAFSSGDVVLADSLYCDYFSIATLIAAGADIVFEQHGGRKTDFRRGLSVGKLDHLVRWKRPKNRPSWMSREHYEFSPKYLLLREVRVGNRILVTTLGQRRVCKRELNKLYQRRWNVELDLRNIKTTLGMDVLSCQTPQMNEKEMWIHLLAYNLIRLVMAQAAADAGVHPREISFKHTVQIWIGWSSQVRGTQLERCPDLFRLIAQRKVGNRPGRVEPRARKRRPKSYPWLDVSRLLARQQIVSNA
jgi:DDE family transposase